MKGQTPPFLGSSSPLQRFLRDLAEVAKSSATVLLRGETGVGKAQAARLLHGSSPRASGPFVVADLAAMAPSLIESTLFGHERGAFTDAHKTRFGVFQKAQGGTLVLQSIEGLSLPLQVKLLRVLQERVIEPLGGEAQPVDVRLVATTGRDLLADVRAGSFREDLYFRVAVVTLEIPPLRSRREDIALLAPVLLETVAARVGVPARTLAPEALERLRTHPWPGNARELENALERVLVLDGQARSDAPIGAEAFDFLAESAHGRAHEVALTALRSGLTADEVVRAMMERALEECRGNVSAAARRVGLTRRAFDYRMSHGPGAPEGEDPG
jgi:two-component system response regulator PilR (NtrC family)